MDPSDAQTACFEAGIKFGTLYHQFAGTPVTPSSAESLARAIERSIENQPYCATVAVEVLTDNLDMTHGYDELTGEHLAVEMVVDYEGVHVRARMDLEDGYPLMRVIEVTAPTE